MANPVTLRNRSSFQGSFTDNLFSNDPLLCGANDNLLLDNNEKLILRPGSQIVYTANPRPLAATERMARAFKYIDDSTLLGVTKTHLWYMTGSTFTEITGAHDALPLGLAESKVSYAEWKGHLFVTDDQGSPVVKVYNDGSWRVRTAGLPAPDGTQYNSSSATALASAITLANAIRTAMMAHFTDTATHAGAARAIHKASDTVSNAMVAAAASNLATLLTLTTSLLVAYQNHHFDIQKASTYHYRKVPDAEWVTPAPGTPATLDAVPAQAEDTAFTLNSIEAPTTLLEAIARLNDLKPKYNTHRGISDVHGDYNNTLTINSVTADCVYDFNQGPCAFLDRTAIYAIANLFKTRMNAHVVAVAGEGKHAIADVGDVIAVANATTPFTFEVLLHNLRISHYGHNDDAEFVGPFYHYTTVLEPHYYPHPPYIISGGAAEDYSSGVVADNWVDGLSTLLGIRAKFNDHVRDSNAHQFAGTTQNPYMVEGSDFTLANYLYAYVYRYTYTIGTTTFVDRSAPLTKEALGVIPTNYQSLSITNLPVLANTAETNYDTAAIVLEIYRTTDDGTSFFYVGEVTNGTTTFTDRVSDTDLQLNEALYTTGGVLSNDAPPKARFLHVVNNKCYYGYVTSSGEILKNRVMESIADDPDSVPGANYLDLDDEIRGISSSRSVPIVFCSRSFVRLEGGYDELGRGALTATVISDSVGLVSENSIVRTDLGIFFAGTDGFYYTDGYTYKKLSGDWNTTYRSLISTATKAARIVGSFDPLTRRIWWAVQRQTASSDNDSFLVLDLNYPFDPHPTWTTCSGVTFSPTALCWFSNSLYRGDSNNYFYKHLDTLKTDPYATALTTAPNWGTAPIVYDFQSCFEDFGQPDVRKWCTWLVWDMERETNVDMQPKSRNNDYDDWQDLGPFSYLSDWVWGDSTLIWGTPWYIWNSSRGIAGQKRRFPANQIRCAYKQIRFTNRTVLIKDSTDTGTCTAAGAGNTLTLDTGGKSWIADPVGYQIYLSHDDYTEAFTIVRRNSSTVLTLLDPNGTVPTTAGLSWKIKGTPKNQQFHMLEYAVLGAPQSRSQQGSRPATAEDV